jgi:hypothetical protein
MAAQFGDIRLPEPHQTSLLIPFTPGAYSCRIVQRFDPEPNDPAIKDDGADFVIELVSANEVDAPTVPGIPWSGL